MSIGLLETVTFTHRSTICETPLLLWKILWSELLCSKIHLWQEGRSFVGLSIFEQLCLKGMLLFEWSNHLLWITTTWNIIIWYLWATACLKKWTYPRCSKRNAAVRWLSTNSQDPRSLVSLPPVPAAWFFCVRDSIAAVPRKVFSLRKVVFELYETPFQAKKDSEYLKSKLDTKQTRTNKSTTAQAYPKNAPTTIEPAIEPPRLSRFQSR